MSRVARCSVVLLSALLVGLRPGVASAGMPFYSLNDVATMRLQVISFFLVLLLATTWAVQRLWNLYQREHAVLPRLSYRGALGFVVVWGLLLQLVLAMIAGARELMTPGAWVKVGTTYRLRGGAEPGPADYRDIARRRALEELRRALWSYARAHDGALPPHDFVPEVPDEVWQTIEPSSMRYIYVGGGRIDTGRRLVAYEPGVFGPRRLGLYSDGGIREVGANDLPFAARE